MQVNLNLKTSKMPFKGLQNNKMINNTPSYNQVSFKSSYNAHTRKGQFDKLIQKLGISKKQADRTDVEFYSMNPNADYSPKNGDSDYIKFYSKMCNIDPLEALFIISYENQNNHPVVVFNSYSTDSNDIESMQLFVLVSPNEELTPTQKAAYKIFYDSESRNLLKKGSYNNPFKEINEETYKGDVIISINKVARGIQNPTWAKYCANAKKLDPVIFSVDGEKKYWLNIKKI